MEPPAITDKAVSAERGAVLTEWVSIGAHEALRKLSGMPRPVLLDGGAGTISGWGDRWSFFCADPFLVLESRGRRCRLSGMEEQTVEADPFELLKGLLGRYRLPVPTEPGLPPLIGGAVGCFGYDLGRTIERLPATAAEDPELPEMSVGFYDWVLVTDRLTGESCLISTGLPEGTERAARRRLRQVRELLKGRPRAEDTGGAPVPVYSNTGRERYLEMVERVREYIAAGDVYQVNFSHRLEGRWQGDDRTLYERLRRASAAPHSAYLDFGKTKILSSSPERFLKLDHDGRVETRPIKGTRPRGESPVEDRLLAETLVASEKDRAENLMIVDLLRNDLGRVCGTGSIRVPALFEVEGHASVWHLVSTVTGELSPERDAVDLLRACFPGGSVTGCPKIRAMEIIEELEPVRRGPYCGAIGYISFTGAMDTSIVIRTLVLYEDRLHLQVGGAVVFDSDPSSEYAETLAKGKAILNAIGAVVEERA
jgi:para-aminobenzoate synthetase component 1